MVLRRERQREKEREREMKREYIQKGVKYKKQIYDYRTLLRSKKDVKRDKHFGIQSIYIKDPIQS